MLIRSQSREELVEGVNLGVAAVFKQNCRRERTITGYKVKAIVDGEYITMGQYSTLEKAVKVLDMVQSQYIETSSYSVFQMPQDEEVEV